MFGQKENFDLGFKCGPTQSYLFLELFVKFILVGGSVIGWLDSEFIFISKP